MSSYATQQATVAQGAGAYGGDQLLNQLLGDDTRRDALINALFGDPNRLFRNVPQFFSYIVSWIEQSGLQIPISQVFGFSQFNAQSARVDASETTTSTTYTDLTTAGPTVSGLSAGTYIVLFGAQASSSVATIASLMSISANAAAAVDGDSCATSVLTSNYQTAVAKAITATVSSSNNSFQCKYRTNGAATATFLYRWIVVLKAANA